MSETTYYFDASDAGPTDSGNFWTDDSNAFDGSISTFAYRDSGVSANPLTGEGTTAPTSGGAITFVEVRVYHRGSGLVYIDEDSVGGTRLGTINIVSIDEEWTNWLVLTAPSGGWTWQKVNDLALDTRLDLSGDIRGMYRVDVKVTYDELFHFYAEDNTLVSTSNDDQTVESIAGALLLANTKYLIVARALTGGSSVSGVYDMWVETADDTSIATKSLNKMEPMQTGNQALASYFFVHSFETDASPADVLLKVTSSTGNSHADQMSLFLLDLDAISDNNTYYFNASDAGPTDSGSGWTGDANAFDGSTSNAAIGTINGAPLTGEGTDAPTSGDAIVGVRARLSFDYDSGGSAGWGPWKEVTAPSGGWTWQKVNDLSVSFYPDSTGTKRANFEIEEDNVGGTQLLYWEDSGSGSTSTDIFRCEVKVFSSATPYLEQATAVDGGTDLSATEATTILAEIAGSDMGTDEHLILGYGRWDNGNNGKYGEVTLYTALDASTQAEVAYGRREGEDTNEQVVVGFAARHQASSGTPNATIYGETASGGGGQHTDGGGYIIALPTSLFADSVFEYTAAATSGLDGTETTIESSGSYTPTTTGNHLIFGRAQGAGTPTALGGMWVESTTTEIRTGDSTPTHNQMWDTGKDDEMMATFQRYGITTAETFNLRAQGAGADFEVADRWLIVVNLNEPSIGPALFPPFLRRPPRHVRM